MATVNDEGFVVGADGHVLSKQELEEARRMDPPVSTGGAPETRKAVTKSIEIDRMKGQVRKFEKRIDDYLAQVAKARAAGRHIEDAWVEEELDVLRRKKLLMEGRIAHMSGNPAPQRRSGKNVPRK